MELIQRISKSIVDNHSVLGCPVPNGYALINIEDIKELLKNYCDHVKPSKKTQIYKCDECNDTGSMNSDNTMCIYCD